MTLNFDFGPKPKGPPNEEVKESEIRSTEVEMRSAEVVETTPFDQFDLQKAKDSQSFLTIMKKMVEMREKATCLKIIDDDSSKIAMEMMVQIKALIKGADTSKQNITVYEKAATYKNGVDKFVLEKIKKPLGLIEEIVSPKIRIYQKGQAELKRRIAQKEAAENAKIAREEAEKTAKEKRKNEEKTKQEALDLQTTLNKEADDAGVDRVSVPIPEVSREEPIAEIVPETTVTQKSEKVVADHGTAKIASTMIVKVENPDLVPRIYCSPDIKKLQSAIEAGVEEIAGCIIEESFDPKVRLSRKKQVKDVDFEF